MYHIVRPVDHDGWLDERTKGIGSSEAGTIMGVNHFETPLKLWSRKMGLTPPQKESIVLEAGHELEPAIAHWFASHTGSYVLPQSEGDWLAVDNDRPWRRVSPDRLFYWPGSPRGKDELCILEIKSTTKYITEDTIPAYWYWQVQYQMGVMGIRQAAIAWLSCSGGRFSFGYATVDFNQADFDRLIKQVDRFWNVNILQNVKPEKIVTSDDCIIRWNRANPNSSVGANEELISLVQRYNLAAERKKSAEDEQDQLSMAIKVVLQDNEVAVDGDGTVLVTWKNSSSTKFDATAFKEENPELYARYSRTTQSRTLSVKKPKPAQPAEAAPAGGLGLFN